MKENKDCFLKVRITKSEREIIDEICNKWGITISEYIRRRIKEDIRNENSRKSKDNSD